MGPLLYKELRLALHPTVYLFLAFAFMLLIPQYPYYVAFFYTTLSVFFIFLTGRETQDISFSAMLPVAKRDIVKARCLLVVLIELAMLVICIPFAIISVRINPLGANGAGMEANAALFGLVLVMYALFNVVFLPRFYRTGYQAGRPFILACTVMVLFVGASEAIIALVPSIGSLLDVTGPVGRGARIMVLAAGAIIFALLSQVAYARSAANFQRVDL